MKNAAITKKDTYLITQKPLFALLLFFVPIAMGNVFQQFYNLVDASILGRFVSEQALAAAAASLSFTGIFIFIGGGFGIGAGVVIGKYFGAEEYKNMKVVIYTALLFGLAMSLILGGIGFSISRLIMIWLQTPADTLDLACTYLHIYFLGMPFVIIYNIISAMFNALGKSKYPLYFLIFSSLLNIALDLLFVTVFDFGISGVAVATVIAQGAACLLSTSVFFTRLKGFSIGKAACFSKKELAKILRIALPSVFQQATISIGLMLIQSTINSFGSQALAGYSVGMRIENLGAAVVIACGAALSTFTAQNLGAKKLNRIKAGYISANIIVAVAALLFFLAVLAFKKQIIYAFIGANCSETAYSVAQQVLVYMSQVMCILGFKHTADGVMRGLGRMKMFTIGNFANIVIRVTFSKCMAPVIGMQAIWIANPLGWSASLILCYCAYRHEIKKLTAL
ncbi:MAG: MATE family efflux transporter [Treponema sp.]|nr:MATE family efflux transporter [Treponema sp.]